MGGRNSISSFTSIDAPLMMYTMNTTSGFWKSLTLSVSYNFAIVTGDLFGNVFQMFIIFDYLDRLFVHIRSNKYVFSESNY